MARAPTSRVHLAPPQSQETQRMWKAMRSLLKFTRGDIEAVAETKKPNVTKFVGLLLDAGYLKVAQPATNKKAGDSEQLQLIKNTGPVAPRFGKDGVYDANIAEPLARPNDRPLNRHAAALLQMLRLVVDRCRQQHIEPQLLEEAEALILKAEGRA